MIPQETRIAIVGAGIGGLTAAVALRRKGFQVCVAEQAPEFKPIGAGITMQINAMQAFQRIGVAEAVANAGNSLGRLVLRFATGKHIFTSDMERFRQEFGAPFIGLHRARLHEVLLAASPADTVKMGCRVESISEGDNKLTLTSTDGQQIEADAVIGADGLNSQVRAYLWGDEPLRYTGLTSWRGVLDDPKITPTDEAGEFWGKSKIFGYVPLGDDKMYWFTTQVAEAGGKDPGSPREAVLQTLADWNNVANQLVENTAPEAIIRTDICDRPPRLPWGKGRITLLGDAAHPMMPNLGQGGGQAVEDAVVLAATLAQSANLESGLREYENRRYSRTRKIVNDSRMASSLGHGSTFFMRFVKKWIVPFMPTSYRNRQFREIFRFEDHE
jgi:2-polyprenyl-6-methoxyphenol hydroxylase-like FAD-dependent oxidoreductase